MHKLVFHIDVNSAYLSWEAARRMRDGEPDLRLLPSAIGGDRDKRTGVILAKSIPAKQVGIATGEPVATALRKCPELLLVRPDFQLYEQCSANFMDICRKYTPIVEKYSIDECFLDMSGTQKIYPEPTVIAHTIKNEIRDTLGFTVNVGISSNKLLSKMASDFEKPDRVHTLFPEEIPEKLWPLPVGSLFSVGRCTAQKLCNAGIRTIGALAKTDPRLLYSLLGMKAGQQLHDYANGTDMAPVLSRPEEAKGYSVSVTLENDVTMLKQAYKVLLQLADSVCMRMRADHGKTSCVSVSIRDNAFQTRSHQCRLKTATDITDEIYLTAKNLFLHLWDQRTPLRLIGIALADISRENWMQASMFEDPQQERARKLDQVMDGLRSRYGMQTIQRATAVSSHMDVGKKYSAKIGKNMTNRIDRG